MIKFKILLILCLFASTIRANDGAYYVSGNQLIPISDTDISVQKEILTLKKVSNQFIEVTVYYEFFNQGEEKEIIVGFEAFAPQGDVDGAPLNGKHPYMRDFVVDLNDEILSYQVAYVSDSLYTDNGKIQSIDLDTFEGNTSGNTIDFFYVYHFNANFKPGLNIVKHSYSYDVSGGIAYNYDFEYVLTAANRWANNQIDDFTLIIDNGEFETFGINNTFFENSSDWLINGIGKSNISTDLEGKSSTEFHIQNGTITFHKEDFKPIGELYVYSENYFGNTDGIPFSYYLQGNIPDPKTDFEKKILRNLPFARRGYVFKTKALSDFYYEQDWYIPNPNYTPDVGLLTEVERDWFEKYEKF